MMTFQTFVMILGLCGVLFVLEENMHIVIREEIGKTWVLLVAGSQGIDNYRHQADVYHAYQLIRAGGILDENIIVFHYNDMASHIYNPSIGTVRHVEGGQDLYHGVPWDYTGSDANSTNLLAALAGRRKTVGKNRKIIMSNAKDRIFVFFSGHGQRNLLHMPVFRDTIRKDQLIDTLLWMRKRNRFKSMVLYIGACHSGCLFNPDVLKDKNIYVVTATNCSHPSFGTRNYWWGTHSQSWSTHFGRAWIYDSEQYDTRTRSIGEQFNEVALITLLGLVYSVTWLKPVQIKRNISTRSTAMEFGSEDLKNEKLFRYQGFKKQSFFWY